jgi:hypothetical protein
MRVVVTGAGGFTDLVLVDQAVPEGALSPHVRQVQGDLRDPQTLRTVF